MKLPLASSFWAQKLAPRCGYVSDLPAELVGPIGPGHWAVAWPYLRLFHVNDSLLADGFHLAFGSASRSSWASYLSFSLGSLPRLMRSVILCFLVHEWCSLLILGLKCYAVLRWACTL